MIRAHLPRHKEIEMSETRWGTMPVNAKRWLWAWEATTRDEAKRWRGPPQMMTKYQRANDKWDERGNKKRPPGPTTTKRHSKVKCDFRGASQSQIQRGSNKPTTSSPGHKIQMCYQMPSSWNVWWRRERSTVKRGRENDDEWDTNDMTKRWALIVSS